MLKYQQENRKLVQLLEAAIKSYKKEKEIRWKTIKKASKSKIKRLQVPWVGIEPTRPKTLDFESSASTSSATKAKRMAKV